jgi:hypothetical protein
MRPRNLILRSFALLVGTYILLIVPWPGVARAYLASVNAVGGRLLGDFGAEGGVVFRSHPTKPWTSVQTLYKRSAKVSIAAERNYDTRQDYLATALVVALILATPLPRRRKAIALVLGLLLINAFVVWRIWIGLVDVFSENQLALIQLAPFWKETVRLAVQIFVGSIESSFIVPVFIWILVTFRRGDLERWRISPAGRDEKQIAVMPARLPKTR